jgi:oxygen-independent coproporphyrinogen-3 oxidase
VEKALSLEPEHLSFYAVQIEEDTPFYQAYIDGTLEPVAEELDRAMYHRAIEMLREAGYRHYEISNAAKPGMACRHNLKYWSFEDYLGLGDSASSFMEGVRSTEKPREEHHVNDFEDNTAEFVFTGLRKTAGISKAEFAARFGKELWDVYGIRRDRLEEFFESGALMEEGDVLRLSERGIDISNRIMSLFV